MPTYCMESSLCGTIHIALDGSCDTMPCVMAGSRTGGSPSLRIRTGNMENLYEGI